jgi:hypothetical protein
MTLSVRRRVMSVLVLPLLAGCLAACDIVTADLRSEETAQWHKTYQLAANGQLEINNVNGKIVIEPSTGNTVDVTAVKKARGASPEAAKAALDRASIVEDVSTGRIRIETRMTKVSGIVFNGGNTSVEYHVKVPAGAEVKFTTVNGGIEATGLQGRTTLETTNGGVTTRNVGGQLNASTTNGGLDIDMSSVPDGGVRLDFVNGGAKMRLPRGARATISASVTNGGISDDLGLETSGETSKRRLEGRLNGGGPRIQIGGTNGGITLSGR